MSSLHQWQALQRAKIKFGRLQPIMQHDWSYLDIGTGNGALAQQFINTGYQVSAVDVIDKSLFAAVKPTLYNGYTIPFNDNAFDCCLLITVLHHCKDVEAVLREARRVSRHQVIVMEDIYTNGLQKWLTLQMDSLVNASWKNHPHNNHSHEEWLQLFDATGFRLQDYSLHPFMGLFRQVTYRLDT